MVGYASNRSLEIGTLEHIIVIAASFYESQPKAWAEYRYKRSEAKLVWGVWGGRL